MHCWVGSRLHVLGRGVSGRVGETRGACPFPPGWMAGAGQPSDLSISRYVDCLQAGWKRYCLYTGCDTIAGGGGGCGVNAQVYADMDQFLTAVLLKN
jgi:hypothetical protein